MVNKALLVACGIFFLIGAASGFVSNSILKEADFQRTTRRVTHLLTTDFDSFSKLAGTIDTKAIRLAASHHDMHLLTFKIEERTLLLFCFVEYPGSSNHGPYLKYEAFDFTEQDNFWSFYMEPVPWRKDDPQLRKVTDLLRIFLELEVRPL